MTLSGTRRAVRIVCDVLLVIGVSVTNVVLNIAVKPSVRGFFCDDDSIRYPYVKSDTVPAWLLLFVPLVVLPVLITIIESWTTMSRLRAVGPSPSSRSTRIGGDGGGSRSLASRCLRGASWSSASMYGVFMFGLGVTTLVTEIGKLTIGRLRPHFIDVCRPDLSAINCSAGYIQNYQCLSDAHPRLIWEARKSFPSGHTSIAFFTAIFLGYYLRRRFATSSTFLSKLFVDFILCSLALFTGLSRVLDHKHHWSDVLGGAVVGLVVATWLIMFMRKSVTWRDVQPIANGDDIIQQPINSPKAYSQECVVYSDDETR